MIGTTLAHYRITGELGSGGMGEVWRAEDTKLGREVALKVLPAEFVDDEARLERFEREARAVAALNHPSIVTIHSVEEADGHRFLTMELVDGKTLDEVIPDGGMALNALLETATPMAEAIAAAHDKGVVHRDLKPQNVMVDDHGRVKVLDFGLAKLQETSDGSDVSEAATEALTGVGMVVGTVPYMSPEQIESVAVDHRTDIFSLGVLLYEMATGERPFSGGSSPALMSSILKDVPTSVVEMRTDLPRHLGRVIGRCLEKNRRDRYQTARDVFNELKILRRESSSSSVAAAVSQPEVEQDSSVSGRPATSPSTTGRVSLASGSTQNDEGFWVAVLPFKFRSADAAVEALAEGLTEDIVTGLSRFSYLRVISRSSTSRFADQTADVRAVGEELGARYVMEGSIRQAGSVLRVAVQLVDADLGAHLWAETYNRPFSPDEIFDLQDDLAPRIVSTIADMNGILPHTMSESIRSLPVEELSPYEAVLRSFTYFGRVTADELAAARTALELALEKTPTYSDAWAMLALLCAQEYGQGFDLLADPLEAGATAARRAVETGPSNHLAHFSLAQVLFFRKEPQAFRNAAERAATLNPMDGNSIAFLGELLTYSGDVERGFALANRAKQLNPNHPGWYWYADCFHSYQQRDYQRALSIAKKVNLPGHWGEHCMIAASSGQLGDREAAGKALRQLLDLRPDFADIARREFDKWWDAESAEHMMEGLGKAGLRIDGLPDRSADRDPSKAAAPTVETGSAGIAVLPFTDMSPAKDQDYFCEGMAEEIMNALVQVDGIRVASRTSTFKAVEQAEDLDAIGRTLGVGQVLEGSVRMAGNRLRVTAQLIEVLSGYQLWSERFDREAEDVFAIQDEIAAGVVAAVTSQLDSGENAVPVREQVGNLEAYRHYLRARHYRYSKNDHASALKSFDEAVAIDPEHAPSWIGRAEVSVLASLYSLIPAREAFQTAKDSLATAVGLQGESAEGCYVEGMIAFCEARWRDAETVFRRSIELQPTFVQAHCWLGFLLSVHHRRDEAEISFAAACEIDPLASFPYAMTACGELALGSPRQAIEPAGQAMTFERENTLAVYCSGIAKVTTGGVDEGVKELETAARLSRRGGFILGIYGWGLAAAGRRDEAEAILEELQSRSKPAPTAVSEAWILAAFGDIEGAWEVLDRAEEELQPTLYFAGMPPFDPLRHDSRFDGLLERLGLPPSPSCERTDSVADADPSPEKSIVVLPFTNMSADEDNEYFSDGLTEEITADLSKIGSLRVISRTSAMQLKGSTKDLRSIGRDLGVRYVLEGGVRKAGSSLRITAKLIDAETDAHLWSEKYSGTMDDVFEVQERVSREIVRALGVRLSSDEDRRLAERPIADARAFELFLQARAEIRRFDPVALERAAEILAQAVAIEGETPPLLYLEAMTKVAQAKAAVPPDPRQLDEAEDRAMTLLERTPDLPQAHALLGSIGYERGWLPQAVWHCKRSLEGTSNDADAFLYLGASYMAAGQPELGLDAGRRMVACDPLASISWMIRGAAYWFVGRPDEALPDHRRGVELDPQNFLAQWALGYTCATLGRLGEAARHARICQEVTPGNAYALQVLALVDGLGGRGEEALVRLTDIDIDVLDPHNTFHLAESWAMAGDLARALEVLESAVNRGFYPYPFINEYCPFMEPLRSLPDFAGILAKAKAKTEGFREEGPIRARSDKLDGGLE